MNTVLQEINSLLTFIQRDATSSSAVLKTRRHIQGLFMDRAWFRYIQYFPGFFSAQDELIGDSDKVDTDVDVGYGRLLEALADFGPGRVQEIEVKGHPVAKEEFRSCHLYQDYLDYNWKSLFGTPPRHRMKPAS